MTGKAASIFDHQGLQILVGDLFTLIINLIASILFLVKSIAIPMHGLDYFSVDS